jgi:hypothetical protein
MWHVVLMSVALSTQMPAAESPPAAPAPEENAASQPASAPAPADLWQVATTPNKAGALETRVLRADGTPVSVGDGLAAMGQRSRLQERARKAANTERQVDTLVGRGLAVGAAGVVAGVAFGALLAGGGMWAWRTAGLPKNLDGKVNSLVNAAPTITLAGAIGSLLGLGALAATGGLWAWLLLRPQPEPPASATDALAASLAWTPKEAQEVVTFHNAQH